MPRFYLDVKDESGNVTNWNIELGPPLILRRAGWKQDSLKAGGQVTVAGYEDEDAPKIHGVGRGADSRLFIARSETAHPLVEDGYTPKYLITEPWVGYRLYLPG